MLDGVAELDVAREFSAQSCHVFDVFKDQSVGDIKVLAFILMWSHCRYPHGSKGSPVMRVPFLTYSRLPFLHCKLNILQQQSGDVSQYLSTYDTCHEAKTAGQKSWTSPSVININMRG